MMNPALILTLLQALPTLIDTGLRVTKALKSDPATPDETKRELDELEARLDEIVKRVKEAPLPS